MIKALFLVFSILTNSETELNIADRYAVIENAKPSYEVFEKAMLGYNQISNEFTLNPDKQYITIIDFDLPSSKKRLWIIDLESNQTLVHTYVSHGKNSGGLMAEYFSNTVNSNQSSLGFYITDNTYYGKNGYSLRLDGIEKNINDNARTRAVVMHGAWYAEESFIQKYGRLGRSFGCPAVPSSLHQKVIDLVKEFTVLYIHDDSEFYKKNSQYLTSEIQ